MIKEFFSAAEAAEYLSKAGEKITVADVRRLAEEGRLPVCFRFVGELGVYPCPAPAQSIIFARPLRRAYFSVVYLRARAGVALHVSSERLILSKERGVSRILRKTSTTNVLRPGVVELPRVARWVGSDGLPCDPPGPGEVWWIVRRWANVVPAHYTRHHEFEVGEDRWLFHVDDLRILTPDIDGDHSDAAPPKASREKASSPGRVGWWPRARAFVTRVAGSVKWSTGKELHAALLEAAGSDDSPFEPNPNGGRNDLIFKVQAGKGGKVSQKTLENALPKIREAVEEAKKRSRFPAGKRDQSGKNGSE